MDYPKKVLIIQSFNANKGDNSVISVMLSSLQKYNFDISITAFDPIKARKEHKIKATEYLFSFRDMKLANSKLSFLWAGLCEVTWLFYSLFILLSLKLNFYLPVPRRKKDIIIAYKNADLIVLPGGHFFTSFNSLINNFSHYYALRYAQLLGKKTMVYSQTVGPYHESTVGRIEKAMANRVLSRANKVTLREEDSLKCYNQTNACVTTETVFLEPIIKLNININKYIPENSPHFIVGCTIHHIYYKHYYSKETYIKLMVSIFNSILSKYKCHLLIIPMEDKYKTGGDRPIIQEMMDIVEEKKRISMVTDDLNSMETANLISQSDIFIGTKTHSIVYGLKTATPTLSISYQAKSTEFMKLFGMEHFAIPMDQLNDDKFIKLFDELYINRVGLKRQMQDMSSIVEKKAEKNNTILKKLIYD